MIQIQHRRSRLWSAALAIVLATSGLAIAPAHATPTANATTGTTAAGSSALVPVSPPIITTDFEDGDLSWASRYTGGYYWGGQQMSVVDDPDSAHGKVWQIGSGSETGGSGGQSLAYAAGYKSAALPDAYQAEFDLRTSATADSTVPFIKVRTTDPVQGYTAQLFNSRVDFVKRIGGSDGGSDAVVTSRSYPSGQSRGTSWNHYKIVSSGQYLALYINDMTAPFLEHTYAENEASTGDWLMFAGWRHAIFVDNFAVSELVDPNRVRAVTATPPDGGFLGSVDVTLSTTTEDAAIHYTTDGTDPTPASTLYAGPIKISNDLTLKAVAVAQGLESSEVFTRQYFQRAWLNREQLDLSVGDTTTVTALFKDILDKSATPVTFSTSDPKTATVDPDTGIVHAVKKGETTVNLAVDDVVIDQAVVSVGFDAHTSVYVSPTGSDTTGKGSKGKPFATVERARDYIRTLSKTQKGGVAVYLRDGEYQVDKAIQFTPADSGSAGAPIVYRSYPGERAVITGGRSLTFNKPDLNTLPVTLPSEARDHVIVADITPGWRPHDIYADGVRQQVARQFNSDDWATWGTLPNATSPTKQPDASTKGMELTLPSGALAGLPNNGDIEMNLLPVVWWNSLPVMTDIDPATNTARLRSHNPSIEPTVFSPSVFQNGGRFNILNAAKFLDEPGEWSVDSEAGKIFWWAKDLSDARNVVAPVATGLIEAVGDDEDKSWANPVSYLEFRDLDFAYVDRVPEDQWRTVRPWVNVRNAENPFAALDFTNVRNIVVADSTIRSTGGYAVAFNRYAQDNRVTHNLMTDLGAGGVELYGYGPGTVDVNKRNTVLGNDISNIGLAPYQHSSGITIYGSGQNDVKLNRMTSLPYTATMITGADGDSMNPTHFNSRAYTDTFGNTDAQYRLRTDDLAAQPGASEFGTADNGLATMKYQHSDFNVFENNTANEYMLNMDDGGVYYGWSSGTNNEYIFNTAHKTASGKGGIFPLYSDDYFNYARWEGNQVWAPQIATIDKSRGTNLWKDNQLSSEHLNSYQVLQDTINKRVDSIFGGYMSRRGSAD